MIHDSLRRFLVSVVLLVISALPAFAGQIDSVLKFTDKATALADATMVANAIGLDDQGVAQFLQDRCVILTVWRASQDTIDGSGNVVHHPLAGFFVLISTQSIVPALLNHPAVQLVVDRDMMNARQAGFVLKSGVTNTILQDIRFSPVFAGMDVPWGGLN